MLRQLRESSSPDLPDLMRIASLGPKRVRQLHSLVARLHPMEDGPGPDRTYANDCRTQDEVRVEENLTTNLKRLLFPS